jgi:hypothetical protein
MNHKLHVAEWGSGHSWARFHSARGRGVRAARQVLHCHAGRLAHCLARQGPCSSGDTSQAQIARALWSPAWSLAPHGHLRLR